MKPSPITDDAWEYAMQEVQDDDGTWADAARYMRDIAAKLERENAELRESITKALDMHLGRCASSEPFSASDYRHHACVARNILRSAMPNIAMSHARS